ncbi:hypothetical protein GCM10018965_019700 [Nonomuraea roseola]
MQNSTQNCRRGGSPAFRPRRQVPSSGSRPQARCRCARVMRDAYGSPPARANIEAPRDSVARILGNPQYYPTS